LGNAAQSPARSTVSPPSSMSVTFAFEHVDELVFVAVPVTLARPAAGRQGHQIDAEILKASRLAQAPPRSRGTRCIERWRIA